MSYIPVGVRRLVIERANHACEYCLCADQVAFYSHEIDHAIAQKHGGTNDVENLVYACWRCNRHKGTDLGSFDPETGEFCFLFNPRQQDWSQHFQQLENGEIVGLTPEARTTIKLLKINTVERISEREIQALNRP